MPKPAKIRSLLALTLLTGACAPPSQSTPTDAGASAKDGPPAEPTTDEFFRIDAIHRIDLTADAAEWQRFLAEHKDPDATPTWHQADLRVDGTPLKQVAFKTFGYGSREAAPDKPNLNIDFEKNIDGQSYAGLSRFRVKNNGQDPSALHQVVTYEALRANGLWAPRTTFAQLYVNGQEYGFYTVEESFGKSFVRARGAMDTGAAYEAGDCHGFMPVNGSCDNLVDQYNAAFNSATTSTGEELVAICNALAKPADKVLTALNPILDIHEWARAIAADLAIAGDNDGFSTAASNFRLYHDPKTNKLRLIIMGPDDTYIPDWLPDPDPKKPQPADYCKDRNPGFHDVFLEQLLATAEGLAIYRDEVQALRKGAMSAARIKERVNAIWGVTKGPVLADPKLAKDADPEGIKDGMIEFIDRRVVHLEAAGL